MPFLAPSGLWYLQKWSSPAAKSEYELPRVEDIELNEEQLAWNNVDSR